MIIYNVKIYTMNQDCEVIEKGFVTIEQGRITAVTPGDPEKTSDGDINGSGCSLYPGFIDAHTHLGLTSAGVGMEGEDLNEEFDPITPHLRIIDGIDPRDYSFQMARSAGVTSAVICPGSANPIGGEIYAVKTSGKRIDKMVIRPVGMKLAMGENPKLTYNDHEQSPCTRMAVSAAIREALYKARRYMIDLDRAAQEDEDLPELDFRSQALIPLLKGQLKAHFHCHRADDIFSAIRIAKEFDLDYILIHCTDGYLVADELAEEAAPVVVGPIICDRCKPEMANLTPKNAAILRENGVEVAICTDHSEVPIEYLPLSVGIARRHGLSFLDGLRAVTSTAAKIVGIWDRVGSIETGKDADLVLFEGDPFQVMSSPEMTLINGEVVYRKEQENG